MRRLARAFAALQCDKYPLPMKWLNVPGFVMSCNSDISVFEEKSKENIRKVKIAPNFYRAIKHVQRNITRVLLKP